MQGKYLLALATGLALSGCATQQFEVGPSEVPVVPIGDVITTMKCAFSNALASDTMGRAGLLGSTASIELDVNIKSVRSAGGDITAGMPVYTGTAGVTAAFSHEETRTLNTSVDFNLKLAPGGTACKDVTNPKQDAGFAYWMVSVIEGINTAVAGPPLASMQQYVYETDFVVTNTGEGGIGVDIIPIKVNTKAGASRSDIHHMKITVKPVHKPPFVVKPDGPRKPKPPADEFVPEGPTFAPPSRRGSFNLG